MSTDPESQLKDEFMPQQSPPETAVGLKGSVLGLYLAKKERFWLVAKNEVKEHDV